MSIDKKANYWEAGGIETMDYLRAKLTPEQFKGFLLGSLLKYPSRSNFKGCFKRDIEKSGIYNKLLLELPEEKAIDKDTIRVKLEDLKSMVQYCRAYRTEDMPDTEDIISKFLQEGENK